MLIFGAGPIGLLHLQLAKRNGAAFVVVVDIKAERLASANKLGADYVFMNKPFPLRLTNLLKEKLL